MSAIDRDSLFELTDLIRTVGTSRWLSCAGFSRGAILIGGSGSYELTFAVRGLRNPDGSYNPAVLLSDGAGNIAGLQINGGEAKALPKSIFIFHAFRINFSPAITSGNPIGLVMSA